MNRPLLLLLSVFAAACAGAFCGELASTSVSVRTVAGRMFGRGILLAVAGRVGIYEANVAGRTTNLAPADESSSEAEVDKTERLHDLVANELLRQTVAGDLAHPEAVERQFNNVRLQFSDEKTWTDTLRASGVSARSLMKEIHENHQALAWLSRHTDSQLAPTRAELETFYAQNLAKFTLPKRFRCSHLFLAAHAETPGEITEEKRNAIDALSTRIAGGENLAELAALSEDEATKNRCGDLGIISTTRVSPEFMAAVESIEPGQVSPPIQTPLGFHIIQVIDVRPAEQLQLPDVLGEITRMVQDRKRIEAIQKVRSELLARAAYLRW